MDFENDDSEESRTIYCGNLANKVTEEILYELFLQAGPLNRVTIPIDRDGRLAGYGFVTFKHKCSVDYALKLFDGIHLYKSRLNLRPRKQEYNAAPNLPQLTIQLPLLTMPMSPGPLLQFNMSPNHLPVPLAPVHNNHNRTPSGRSEHYRNNNSNEQYDRIEMSNIDSLQGRFPRHSFKRDRDNMRPNDNHRHNYKRHKR